MSETLFDFLNRMHALPAQADRAAIDATFARLRVAPESLFKTMITTREDGGLLAHFSAIRRYSGTWTLQHLASASGDGHTTLALCRALIQWCQAQPTMRFVHANYALGNSYSSRIVGSALADTPDDSRWVTVQRVMATMRGIPLRNDTARVRVRAASSCDDLTDAEAVISQSEPGLLICANDWRATTLPMQSLQDEYRNAGLSRTRHLFMAESGGAVAGFALAEVSDIGLNLREDCSAARIWISRDAQHVSDAVGGALLRAVSVLYESQGRDVWHVIGQPMQADLFKAAGSTDEVAFVEATAHRDSVSSLSDI
jgi:hypothetical protein